MPPPSPTENRRWVLARRPEGAPAPDDFRLERGPVPEPGPGQVLLAVEYLSLDPYMRGRMSEARSYTAPIPLGGLMVGQTVGRVVRSEHPDFAPGDRVTAYAGWQEYAVVDAAEVKPIPAGMKPVWSLGVLGMPGLTAWYGLTRIGRPKPGETVVVAAATGAVGSLVGQIAKRMGCRAVGIAGGPDKCAYAVDELGFDACVDHRRPDFEQALAAACPNGVDVDFESVGGKVLFAVLPLLNDYSRIALCGLVSLYNGTGGGEDGGDRSSLLLRTLQVRKVTLQGFIIVELFDQFGPFREEMLPLVQSGAVRYREEVVQGLERAPEAFIGLLKGEHLGKLIVQVAA